MGARKLKRSELLGDASAWELLVRLAAGGMGAVFLGVRRGERTPIYAIKRAHSHLLEEPTFRRMFSTEAQLALRIRHPNAIGVRFVDETDGELLLIMDYFEGCSLGELLAAAQERKRRIPPAVVLRIVLNAARGLEAAHSLTDEAGRPLGIVHRDVSPQNILVGVMGTAAIVDFGVAKAAAVEATRTVTEILKGKTAYMAPEYVRSRVANAQTDVFSLGIVAWEAIANRRLFKCEDELSTMQRILDSDPAPRLNEVTAIDAAVADVIALAVEKDATRRLPSAAAFANALERCATDAEMMATQGEVAATVKSLMGEVLNERHALVTEAIDARRGPSEVSASLKVTTRYPQPVPLSRDSEPSGAAPGQSAPVHVLGSTTEMLVSDLGFGPAESAALAGRSERQMTAPLPQSTAQAVQTLSEVRPTVRIPHPELQPTQETFALPTMRLGSDAAKRPAQRRSWVPLGVAIGTTVLIAGVLVATQASTWSSESALPVSGDTTDKSNASSEITAPAPALADTLEPVNQGAQSPKNPTPAASGDAAGAPIPPEPTVTPTATSKGASTAPTPVPKATGPLPMPKTDAGWRPKTNPYAD